MITPDDEVARLMRLVGDEHRGSEIAGPALDPSGERMYFSSQRGSGKGITYEITGPFRTTRTERPQTSGAPTVLPADEGDGVFGGIVAMGAAIAAAVTAVVGRRLRRRGGRSAD